MREISPSIISDSYLIILPRPLESGSVLGSCIEESEQKEMLLQRLTRRKHFTNLFFLLAASCLSIANYHLIPSPQHGEELSTIRKPQIGQTQHAAVVLIASPDLNLLDPVQSMKKSIESIYAQTDTNRTLTIYAVFQPALLGEAQKLKAQHEFDNIEANTMSPSLPGEKRIRTIFSDNNSTIECSRE